MNTNPSTTKIAAGLLGLRFNDAARNSRPLPAQSATYFWDPALGGASVIVGSDAGYLYANSSVTPDQHVANYLAGGRSNSSG